MVPTFLPTAVRTALASAPYEEHHTGEVAQRRTLSNVGPVNMMDATGVVLPLSAL